MRRASPGTKVVVLVAQVGWGFQEPPPSVQTVEVSHDLITEGRSQAWVRGRGPREGQRGGECGPAAQREEVGSRCREGSRARTMSVNVPANTGKNGARTHKHFLHPGHLFSTRLHH